MNKTENEILAAKAAYWEGKYDRADDYIHEIRHLPWYKRISMKEKTRIYYHLQSEIDYSLNLPFEPSPSYTPSDEEEIK